MRSLLLVAITLLAFPANATERFLDIQEVSTPSGINVWLVEDHSVPVISLKFAFKGAGSFSDPNDKQGLVQLLSNTMDEGAGDITSQEFQKELSDHSISLSFAGGRDSFSGSLKTLTEYKDKAFGLLQLALTEPRFDDEPLERMKQANLSRIKNSMTQPNWMAARLMNDIAYENHPYARNRGGTLTTLKNITSDDLRNFVKNELSRDRLIIAISGDITPEEVSEEIENIFNSLPVFKRDELHMPITLQNQGSYNLFEQDIPQTIIKINLPGIRHGDNDYFSAKVMNHIYGGGGFGSKLMQTIREKEGLTYGVYSGLSEMDMTETLSISTSTKNETVEKTINLIKQEAKNLKNNSISEEELQDAKDYILGSMPVSLTSNTALTSIMMSLQNNNLPSTYLDTIDVNINSVTTNDIKRIAQRMLMFDKAVTVLVGNPENIIPTNTITTLPNVE